MRAIVGFLIALFVAASAQAQINNPGLPTINGVLTGPLVATKGVDLSQAITYSGGLSAANSSLYESLQISGTCSSSSNCSPNNILITADRITAPRGLTALPALLISHAFGGSTAIGTPIGIESNVTLNSPTNAGNSPFNYVAGAFQATSITADGGVPGAPQGNLFGIVSNVFAQSGATDFASVIGEEVDVACQTGSNCNHKIGVQIVSTNTDLVAPGADNIGLVITAQSGAGGFSRPITFGSALGFWPCTSSGCTLISAVPNGGGAGAAGTADTGIDFANVTFTGKFLNSIGFSVDKSGNIVGVTLKTPGVAVASLPSASTVGAGGRAFVTDSIATLATGLGNTVVGGGANQTPVYSDGTTWKIGG